MRVEPSSSIQPAAIMPSSKTFTWIAVLILLISLARFTYADIAVLNPENKSVELFIDYKIVYTPAIPENGMIGFLIRAHPSDACSKLDPPPPSNHTFQNWFVLADRTYNTHCTNREKIKNAAEAGYKVIILYSPYENPFQPSMTYYSLEHSNTSIPAILVSHEDGNALAKKYLYQTGFKIYVTSDIPPNLSYYLLPFAIVIGVCLLLTISFMIFQLIRCVQERRKAQRHRLSKKYLKKLPLQKFEKGIYYETCAICLDDYVDGEKIRILPCNHGYHMKCIDPWLTKNRRVCPVCKAKVTLPGMPESDDSDSDNDRRARSTQNEDANERTQLLPSSSSSSSRNHRSRRYNLNRLIVEVRGDEPSPSAAAATSSSSSSIARGQPNYNTASTSRYQPLDDTLSQPGPSTSSAPVISELSSQRGGSSSGISGGSGSRSKKKRSHSRNVQVVAAEIAPLIAPPQLSINCDSDVEQLPSSRSATLESNDSAQGGSSSQKRPSKRPSVDHIV